MAKKKIYERNGKSFILPEKEANKLQDKNEYEQNKALEEAKIAEEEAKARLKQVLEGKKEQTQVPTAQPQAPVPEGGRQITQDELNAGLTQEDINNGLTISSVGRVSPVTPLDITAALPIGGPAIGIGKGAVERAGAVGLESGARNILGVQVTETAVKSKLTTSIASKVATSSKTSKGIFTTIGAVVGISGVGSVAGILSGRVGNLQAQVGQYGETIEKVNAYVNAGGDINYAKTRYDEMEEGINEAEKAMKTAGIYSVVSKITGRLDLALGEIDKQREALNAARQQLLLASVRTPTPDQVRLQQLLGEIDNEPQP